MCVGKHACSQTGRGWHSHHMATTMGWIMWLVIIIGIAKVWLLSNYDLIPASTWHWLAPVGFLVIALALMISCCCYGKSGKSGHGHGESDECKDGACKDGDDHCGTDGMGKQCKCGGNGPCQCSPKSDTKIANH